MTDQELIQVLMEAGNCNKFIRRADYWALCCREAASRLAALQAENAEKDKRISRVEAERDTYRALGTAEELSALVKAHDEGPCGLCRYGPPSSGDGKPCTMCPAEGLTRAEAEAALSGGKCT